MASIAQLEPDSAELKKRIERFQTVLCGFGAIAPSMHQFGQASTFVLFVFYYSLFVFSFCSNFFA